VKEMKLEDDVESFAQKQLDKIVWRCKCKGDDDSCDCRRRHRRIVTAYESCVPSDFWFIEEKDIDGNREVFDRIILPYTKKMITACKNGFGLLLLGPNGVGKTIFMSFVLMKAIRRGLSVYYTTVPSLDYWIKASFNDPRLRERLEWYLTSQILAIDELGSERFKDGDSFTRTQLERILKERFDSSAPVLLASNAKDKSAVREMYGPAIGDLLEGKYAVASLSNVEGTYRKKIRKRMKRLMGI
jgi:DNA replication protein DnaC